MFNGWDSPRATGLDPIAPKSIWLAMISAWESSSAACVSSSLAIAMYSAPLSTWE